MRILWPITVVFCLQILLVDSVRGAEISTGKPAPRVMRFKLDNGLDVSIINIVDEPIFLVFTVYPGGFLADDAEHSFWAQLVERLNTQTYGECDGKTVSDHFLLETWSRPDKWAATLKAHAVIMQGVDITDEHLKIFKEDVIVGARFIDKDLNAHELACAVFAQGYRYSRKDVCITREIQNATLPEVLAYRNRLWQTINGARLCIFSSLPAEDIKSLVVEQFGSIPSEKPREYQKIILRPGPLKITWDYKTCHLILAWQIGAPSLTETAALFIASNLLEKNWDREGGGHGRLAVCSDIRSPDGVLFIMNLATHSTWAAEEAQKDLFRLLKQLGLGSEGYVDLESTKKQLAFHLLMPSVPLLINKLPQHASDSHVFHALLNYRRLWGQLEWYYGNSRSALGNKVAATTPQEIRQTIRKYLQTDQCTLCTIVPRGDWDK